MLHDVPAADGAAERLPDRAGMTAKGDAEPRDGNRPEWVPAELVDDATWSAYLAARCRLMTETVHCVWCDGTGDGQADWEKSICGVCDGTGWVSRWADFHAPWLDADRMIDRLGSPEARILTTDELDFQPVRRVASQLVGVKAMCPSCSGARYPCRECGWAGTLPAPQVVVWADAACPYCQGDKWMSVSGDRWPCGACARTGRVSISRYWPIGEDLADTVYTTIERLVADTWAQHYVGLRGHFSPRLEAEPGIDWHGIDFSKDDLSLLDLERAELQRCCFGNVRGTSFRGADLTGATFSDPDGVAGCDFEGAVLDEAVFRNVDAARCNIALAESVLGADFRGVRGLSFGQRAALAASGAEFGTES